jgi:hypothetical protein
MSYSLFEKFLLFSYDNPYTHFVQCVEYNNSKQTRLLISAGAVIIRALILILN